MKKLFVLKCHSGYVRSDSRLGCLCVGLDKASVFNEENLMQLEALSQRAAREGIKSVRLVELKVIEKVNSAREDGLKQSLYEMMNEKHRDPVADRKKWEDILLEKLILLGENDFVELAEQVRCKKFQP